MGNSQSDPADKIKIYKITKVVFSSAEIGNEKISSFMIKLHDYITYRDKNSKYFTLIIKGELDKNRHNYKVGDYLLVDLGRTSFRNSSNYFVIDDKRFFGDDEPPIGSIEKEQVVEKRDSDGNIILSSLAFFGEMGENRERYQTASIESWGGNIANFRQTSYDMPPKW